MDKALLGHSTIENTQTVEHLFSGGKSLSEVFSTLTLTLISESEDELIIDMQGIDAPISNALRRIMISEVPTMAIEDVDLYQNTSVLPDEVLAHRLGLIPIKADPDKFRFKSKDDENPSSQTSLLFKLHVKCTRSSDGSITGENVYSKDLIWHPLAGQENFQVHPVHSDILIAKLGPGQEIEADLWCEKGLGANHTKWSPVCTASYRLMPSVSLIREVRGEEARALKKKCPVGVFDIEDGLGVVKNERFCTSCRECLRDGTFPVRVEKVKDHFICKG
jgi:DNA-directed RNA polymerase I and III subunit RPAC1